jgi:hypothetical protein
MRKESDSLCEARIARTQRFFLITQRHSTIFVVFYYASFTAYECFSRLLKRLNNKIEK